MKNILITTGIYPPDIGGPATYVNILINELPKRGYNLRVISFGEKDNGFVDNGVEVFVVNRNKNYLVKYLEYFRYIYKNLNWANKVYTQGPVCEGFPTMLACKLKDKEYFLKIVGDYAWEQYRQRIKEGRFDDLDIFQERKYDFATELKRRIQVLVAKKARKVITPSYYLKSIIEKWRVQNESIRVIYNAVQINKINENKESLRKEFGFKDHEKIILSAGRLVPWKGMSALMKALSELNKNGINSKLLIAGDGPWLDDLKKESKMLGLDERVMFLGQLAKGDLHKYMKASDVFVLNSQYEGLSHVLIEAIFMDLPIVASNMGGNVELIESYKKGQLAEYDNVYEIAEVIKSIFKNKNFNTRGEIDILEKCKKENMLEELISEIG